MVIDGQAEDMSLLAKKKKAKGREELKAVRVIAITRRMQRL